MCVSARVCVKERERDGGGKLRPSSIEGCHIKDVRAASESKHPLRYFKAHAPSLHVFAKPQLTLIKSASWEPFHPDHVCRHNCVSVKQIKLLLLLSPQVHCYTLVSHIIQANPNLGLYECM